MTNLFEAAATRQQRLAAALAALDGASLAAPELRDEAPVFICATGWRTGSTLLQRILMTDPTMLAWGEPMDRLGWLSRLVELLCGVDAGWPPASHYLSHRPPFDRTGDWIPNLSPDPADMRAGFRALLDTWFAAPARRDGFRRWGIKEVRWRADEARLLRWLYPNARLIVLTRHPVSAYHSLAQHGLGDGGGGWWVRWPDRHVGDLDSFARHWNELAVSWAGAAQTLDATVMRYEDLVEGRADFASLAARLGLSLRPQVALAKHAGGSERWRPLPPEERDRVNSLTTEGRRLFGYGD